MGIQFVVKHHLINMKLSFILISIAAMAAIAQSGEVTKMLETLEGYDHFSNMRVFIDQPSCADGNPDDMCSLEGYRFPCCHVHKGTDVKDYITMMSQEDSVDNGLITCKVAVGADTSRMDSCLEPEFCNGLNTTCPMNGPQPVQFNFGWSTDDWGRTHIGSRPETLLLQLSEGENMLKFTLNFKVFDP